MSDERRCAISGCGASVHARGWCNEHYNNWYRHGDPARETVTRRGADRKHNAQPVAFRFWSKVDFSDPDGCWNWKGASAGHYGETYVDGEKRHVHRVAFELVYGEIEPGLVVRHHCDNRMCVRPDHLGTGTQADNCRDMGERGRWRNQHAAGPNHDPKAWTA